MRGCSQNIIVIKRKKKIECVLHTASTICTSLLKFIICDLEQTPIKTTQEASETTIHTHCHLYLLEAERYGGHYIGVIDHIVD